jgi:hypothetical protein
MTLNTGGFAYSVETRDIQLAHSSRETRDIQLAHSSRHTSQLRVECFAQHLDFHLSVDYVASCKYLFGVV